MSLIVLFSLFLMFSFSSEFVVVVVAVEGAFLVCGDLRRPPRDLVVGGLGTMGGGNNNTGGGSGGASIMSPLKPRGSNLLIFLGGCGTVIGFVLGASDAIRRFVDLFLGTFSNVNRVV